MKSLLAVPLAVLMLTPAFAQSGNLATPRGNQANGQAIANTWCSACHLVAAGETRSVVADVPTFTSIAKSLPTDTDVLAAFIAAPHPPMPNLGLSRQEIQDVLAYIAALK